MKDEEKILRWNLQEALKEKSEPLPNFDGMSFSSASFEVKEKRDKKVDKCKKELEDYLKNN